MQEGEGTRYAAAAAARKTRAGFCRTQDINHLRALRNTAGRGAAAAAPEAAATAAARELSLRLNEPVDGDGRRAGTGRAA